MEEEERDVEDALQSEEREDAQPEHIRDGLVRICIDKS